MDETNFWKIVLCAPAKDDIGNKASGSNIHFVPEMKNLQAILSP